MIYIYKGKEYTMNSVIKYIKTYSGVKEQDTVLEIFILELLQGFYFPCEFVHMGGGKGLWNTISMCPELNPLFALKPNVGSISIYKLESWAWKSLETLLKLPVWAALKSVCNIFYFNDLKVFLLIGEC